MFEYQKASVALESTFPRHAQHPYLSNKENVRWRCRRTFSINIILFLESFSTKYKEIDQIFIFNMCFS